MQPLRVLTWNVHENYLRCLFQCPHDFYLITKPLKRGEPLHRLGFAPYPENVHDVLEQEVKNIDLDVIIFQRPGHYLKDQHEILSAKQKHLPKIYLEHGLPLDVIDMRHSVDDAAVHIVHVTSFNDLMWDCSRTRTHVIDYGALLPRGVQYAGDLPKGLVVSDTMDAGGRRLGMDIYQRVRTEVPLDLIEINSGAAGSSLTEISAERLPVFASHYRFLFNPARYASLNLVVCQMMMMGMPVVGLATSELSTIIRYGISGYVHTNLRKLIERMKGLIKDPTEAHRLGRGAYRYAHERFNIKRFIKEWNELLELVSKSSVIKHSAAYDLKNA